MNDQARVAGEAGVADIVGNILLVGITVLATGAFALLLFAFEGPEDKLHADVELRVDPGGGGWLTGDEHVQLRHLGGEPIPAAGTTIIYTIAGTTDTFEGGALATGFADGTLSLGETWEGPDLSLDVDTPVDARILTGGRARLLASGIVTGEQAGGLSPCLFDTTPPTVSFTQSPADITTSTVGAVNVTAALVDVCSGVDPSVTPHLFRRVTPDGSFTDLGPMTSLGGDQWTLQLAPPLGTWLAHAGETVFYYVSPANDTLSNTGQSGTQTDIVDPVYTYTYVNGTTATTGTVTNLTAARSASDGGAEATFEEGATTTTPTSDTGTFSGSTTGDAGATSPGDALASDDAHAALDSTGEYVEAFGFDLPPTANGVTSVTIGFEGRKAFVGGQDVTARLSYNIGGTTGPTDKTVVLATSTDTTTLAVVTLDRSWTVADVEAMRVRVAGEAIGNRPLEVDHIFVTVTYAAGGTTYSMDIQADWTGVPAGGGTHRVEARYRVTGDAFTMEVEDGGSAWRTCAGTMSSTTAQTFACDLVGTEYNGGQPRIRIRDQDPAATTGHQLLIDHLRVATL